MVLRLLFGGYLFLAISFSLYIKTILYQKPKSIIQVKVDDNFEINKLFKIDQSELNFSKIVSSNELTLIYFWATWCQSCRIQMPHLEKVYSKYREKGLEIVAVSLDEDNQKLKDYLKAVKYSFNIAISKDRELKKKLGIVGIPVAVAVSKKGKVLFTHSDSSLIEKKLHKWLKE